jgi:hypothetical protein
MDAQQRAQRGVRLAGHRCGLGAALAHLVRVAGAEGGRAEGVGGVRVGRDGADGETRLEGVAGGEAGDGVHRALLAFRAGLRVFVGEWRELGAEVGEDFAVVGAGGVGVGGVEVHGARRVRVEIRRGVG